MTTAKDITDKITPEMIEVALSAFNKCVNEPLMVACDRCDGKGFHHGFGEDGASPDWCLKCGGNAYDVVPGEEQRAMHAALVAAFPSLPSALSDAERERDELRLGIKRLSDEEEMCAETDGGDAFDLVRLAAKLAGVERAIEAEKAATDSMRMERDYHHDRAMRLAGFLGDETVQEIVTRATAAESTLSSQAALLGEIKAALTKIAEAPAWGAPERWETTPAEVRQLARETLIKISEGYGQ